MTIDRAVAGGARKDARPQDWLAGGGEMGAIMRSTDWSKTMLGPIERWPRSLTTMLGVVLGSRFPMLLWWGPDLLHLYNDAYRPILRDKHPASLAAPAALVWAEIWDVAGPMARSVQEGGPATWTEDLQLFINSGGMAEETYFTFSYSPVPGDDGRIGGLLNTVQETTVKVRSERQIRMLHDLSARAADAKSEDEAYRMAVEVLSANELDLPFVLLYVLNERADDAQLVGVSGWKDYEGRAKPTHIPIAGDASAAHWPLAEVIRTAHEVVIDDLYGRFGPLPVGRWSGRPERAIVLPLSRAGQPTPYAFLVAGISPHRALDDRYRRFFRATADQVTIVIASARAHEVEKKRAEALAEIDRAKTAFFSNVSHEFRTPLTLMLGPTEDALSSPGEALSGEPLRMVRRNALRLMKLVNSLLDFSRIESGRVQAIYEPTDLAAMTTDLASAFRSAIERTGLTFEVDCESLPEPIYLDHDLWEKIVLNLLSNALKFTFEGSIGVSVRWCGDHAELKVRDTGTGIAEKELSHLFERFHRIHGARSRTHEGSGLGLALAHDLVRLHGGTVQVASSPSEGTTFTVSLPRGSAHLPPERVVAKQSIAWSAKGTMPFVEEALRWSGGSKLDAVGPSAATPTKSVARTDVRILVVDDNADLRDYIVNVLDEHYAVDTAVDGLAALEAARLRKPALVLSDVMMPRLDGFGLLRALRADATLRDVPVILLSARAGEDSTIEGLEAGADDYLVKPFAARELLARVRTHVELARQREVFERFFTLSLDMMCIAGVDGYFRRVSPAFDALGYSSEELLGRPFLDFVHPDDMAATLAAVEKLAKGESAIHFENRYRCKDGSHRWLSWCSAPDTSGTLYAIARDVTETKRTQEALARASEAAEAANRELESFSYSVAHDLRAPLRSIDGFSQALLEDYADKLDADGKKYLSFVRESAQQMAQLIDDLLALSRVTRSDLHRESVDLSALAQAAIARIQRSQPDRRVDVVIQEGLRGEGDPRLLTVVLDNLFGNAWKFTGRRDEAHIEFGAASNDGHRVYFLRDNGAGFDMAFASKLFGVFQRLHAATEFEGTGVGLATVQRVLSRHGGRVWAEGEVNRGATFFFTLYEKDLAT
jgi:PAS domain S-box-containing protein